MAGAVQLLQATCSALAVWDGPLSSQWVCCVPVCMSVDLSCWSAEGRQVCFCV